MFEPDATGLDMFAYRHGLRVRRRFKLAATEWMRVPEL